MATYSSRGPTRYELGLKPDVVAPGNKIVSLEAAGSYLATRYPSQHVAGSGRNGYFADERHQHGRGAWSAAAPRCCWNRRAGPDRHAGQAGAAADGVVPCPKEGLVAAGTGSVNLLSARRVNGTLSALPGLLPTVTVGGRTVRPSGLVVSDSGSLVDRAYGRVGLKLLGAARRASGLPIPRR